MYPRALSSVIPALSQFFPALLITGPRQVGKSTLLKCLAEDSRGYVSLDDYATRTLASQDPGLFMKTYPAPMIIDEIQYAPELLTYIKIQIDNNPAQNGLYWLIGSQKFSLMRGVQESLAGRIGILDLLGLSASECARRNPIPGPFLPTSPWLASAKATAKEQSVQQLFQNIWQGSFPRVQQATSIEHDAFYSSYIQTYIQRDVRDLIALTDEIVFHNFLVAVAARTG